MAEKKVPQPPCIYCSRPVPISDFDEYTILKLVEEGYRYAHNRCASSAARDPLKPPPIQSIAVTKSRGRRKDECA